MSEVVVTVKAGTGYDVPWIVFHAESIEEAMYLIGAADDLLDNVAFLSKRFSQVYDSTPNGVAALIKQELGAEVLTVEPVTPTNTEPPKPWERTAPAPTPKPWETGGAAPAAPTKIGIKLPWAKEDQTEGSPFMLQREFKNYFFQQRNKLTWNKDRKVFEFESHPSGDMLGIAREWVARLGGSVEE